MLDDNVEGDFDAERAAMLFAAQAEQCAAAANPARRTLCRLTLDSQEEGVATFVNVGEMADEPLATDAVLVIEGRDASTGEEVTLTAAEGSLVRRRWARVRVLEVPEPLGTPKMLWHLVTYENFAAIRAALVARLESVDEYGLGNALISGMLPEPVAVSDGPFGTDLNAGQQEAALAVMEQPLSFVWGPPGTGKTKVIGAFVQQAVQSGHTVLLVSNNNVAVDNAVGRALVEGVLPGEVVRVGRARLDEAVPATPGAILQAREAGELAARRTQLADLLTLTRQAGEDRVEERADAVSIREGYADESNALQQFLAEVDEDIRTNELNFPPVSPAELASLIASARVVACTFATLLMNPLLARSYSHVVVDEATATQLPFLVFAASLAEHVAFVGDFRQTGPISPVLSALPAGSQEQFFELLEQATGFEELPDTIGDADWRDWCRQDVFQRLQIDTPDRAASSPICWPLFAQYRFGEAIMYLTNRIAYGGYLECADSEAQAGALSDEWNEEWRASLDHEVVVLTPGTELSLAPESRDRSWRWQWSADLAAAIAVHALLTRSAALGPEGVRPDGSRPVVGVVTPFRPQVPLLRAAVWETLARVDAPAEPWQIRCGTVHAMQGQEFDVVIFDMVRGAGHGSRWITDASFSRGSASSRSGATVANVAITRAQRQLIVIGELPDEVSEADDEDRLLPVLLEAVQDRGIDAVALPVEAIWEDLARWKLVPPSYTDPWARHS